MKKNEIFFGVGVGWAAWEREREREREKTNQVSEAIKSYKKEKRIQWKKTYTRRESPLFENSFNRKSLSLSLSLSSTVLNVSKVASLLRKPSSFLLNWQSPNKHKNTHSQNNIISFLHYCSREDIQQTFEIDINFKKKQ